MVSGSPNGSPKASPMASPKASPKPMASPKAMASPKPMAMSDEMDISLRAWIANSYEVLQWPGTILSIAGLLVAGTFAEIAPRKSLEFLDNTFGSFLFFIIPFLFAVFLDWPTGLLAAVVSLTVFARLKKEDSSEGFSDSVDDTNEKSTKIISNPHRWFIERMLGERPVAISSDRIITSAVQDGDVGKSTSSSNTPANALLVESSSSSHK